MIAFRLLLLTAMVGLTSARAQGQRLEPILLPPGSVSIATGSGFAKDLPAADYPPSCFRPGRLPSFEESYVPGAPFFEYRAEVVDQQNPLALRAPVDVRVWRVPCHFDGSAILIEFQRLGGLPLAPDVGIRAGEDGDAFRARISYEANTLITDDTTAIIPVFDADGRTVYAVAATPGLLAAEVDLDGELEVLIRSVNFDAILPFPAFVAADYDVEGRMVVNPRHTGSWYARARSGEGVFVEVFEQDDGQRGVLVSWYTYLDGRQQWLVGSTLLTGPRQRFVAIPVIRTSGPGFGDAFDTRAVVQEDWGTLTLSWFDCSRMELRWDGLDGAGRLDLIRLTTIADFDCR